MVPCPAQRHFNTRAGKAGTKQATFQTEVVCSSSALQPPKFFVLCVIMKKKMSSILHFKFPLAPFAFSLPHYPLPPSKHKPSCFKKTVEFTCWILAPLLSCLLPRLTAGKRIAFTISHKEFSKMESALHFFYWNLFCAECKPTF